VAETFFSIRPDEEKWTTLIYSSLSYL